MKIKINRDLAIAMIMAKGQIKKPKFCDIIITENCMLRCKMCNMWQSSDDSGKVSTEAWKGFINRFADFVGGNAQVQFVGGEPLLRQGILEVVRRAKDRGLSTTMTTNGYLIDQVMAEKITDSGLDTLVFSLDTRNSQTHDFLRGRSGVYAGVVKAIEIFGRKKNVSPRVHIVTTIMQSNLDDLSELAEWVERSPDIDGMSFQAVAQPFFTPLDNRWYERSDFSFLWPKDIAQVECVLDRLSALKRRGYKITNPPSQFDVFRTYFKHPERFVRVSHCHLGHNSVSVNTAGDIFLCLSLKPIGRIQDESDMGQIWFSKGAVAVREQIRNCQNNCKLMINCFFEEEEPGLLEKKTAQAYE